MTKTKLPPLPKKSPAVFHHPLGFELYDGFSMDLHAMAYAEVCIASERERCAALCDDEAMYRTSRETCPWPGDDPAIQGHKAVTARKLAALLRAGA